MLGKVFEVNCPRCDVGLVEKKRGRQRDGTEFIEFRCPKCKERFMDLKIPYDVLGFQRDDPKG